jgi:hypothetical protein
MAFANQTTPFTYGGFPLSDLARRPAAIAGRLKRNGVFSAGGFFLHGVFLPFYRGTKVHFSCKA